MSTHGIHIEINPKSRDRASRIAFLDQAFPGHWNRATFDWYIARSFHGIASDTFVASEGQRVLAEMTMCYRQIGTDSSSPIDIGVLSSAATLPSERGKGHYGRLLEAAREQALMKGYAALLGFVTRDNSSAKGLAHRGAKAVPSFYIVSVPGRVSRGNETAAAAAAAAAAAGPLPRLPSRSRRALADFARLAQRESARVEGTRFLYARADDWRRQFIERPSPVRVLRLAHDSLALVETVGGTDRLQWLAAPREKATACIARLARASAAAGRQFFLYTLDPLLAAAARRLGLAIRPGYLMLWPTGHGTHAWRSIASASWSVQSGDRL